MSRDTPRASAFGEGPVHRMLGLELGAWSDESAEVRMDVRPEFVHEGGIVQGGILTALADAAAVYLLIGSDRPGHGVTSIDLSVNFLNPATPGGPPLSAVAVPVKRGRRVAVCRSSIYQGDTHVAEGVLTYLFLEPRTA